MNEVFHELPGYAGVSSTAELEIPRTKALLEAVHRSRHCKVVCILRPISPRPHGNEIIIADFECDGIPPKNTHGLQYRERMALRVFADPSLVTEALPLRKNFPVLIHLNQGAEDFLPSLCLYFEPSESVLRTWTAESFLQRIRWWLEKSASGDLHPIDQPIEQLFFESPYELIIPWNMEKLREVVGIRYILSRKERSPLKQTLFLRPAEADTPVDKCTVYIELETSPILHGQVERDPTTLGQLVDLLSSRGTDLLTPLKAALADIVDSKGVPESKSDVIVVLALVVPLVRNLGKDPERLSWRAYIIPTRVFELGEMLGVFLKFERKYFLDVVKREQPTTWRDQNIFPMEVLQGMDPRSARIYSGHSTPGPKGVLLGAGSLGSALANLWSRSGWGEWTVVDKDHIKPHNLSRHTAFNLHIGDPKASVVSQLHDEVMTGASRMIPLITEATGASEGPYAEALRRSDLVVDASASIEYPRSAGCWDNVPRHISVFLTPNGNGAALLAEDSGRCVRLCSIEAQYYRALIQNDWGEKHLQEENSSFWSGRSCRDISAVMPFSRVLAHASTLAEQVQHTSDQELARIRLWNRDTLFGSVQMYEVEVFSEIRIALGEMTLMMDQGLKSQLETLRLGELPKETGGILLGYYDLNINTVFIVAALSAPSDSKASEESFERGINGLVEAVQCARDRTAGMVGYIGEWHSHPQGHSANASSQDLDQLCYLSSMMADEGLPAIQLIVGDQDIQVFQGKLRRTNDGEDA